MKKVLVFTLLAMSVPITLLASRAGQPQSKTDAVAEVFKPFAPSVKTRASETQFFVESDGMPDHRLMVGITAWQQQVPIPQRYTGSNAWQFPLTPVVAENPLSAKDHFFRGAIAIAANGVPIFNPIKNDGRTDTFLAGELDEFGGHSGQADDYHYHIAPLHLQEKIGKGKPVGYALDGYPLYGLTDADGSVPKDLDKFNGHSHGTLGYHYHATRGYPYINGGFHGQVTELGGQVDPQPRAMGVRPATPPLRGAKITGFTKPKPGAYSLTYTVSGETRRVDYSVESDGSWLFNYIDGQGNGVKEYFQPQRDPGQGGGGRRGQGGGGGGQGGGQGGGRRGQGGGGGGQGGGGRRGPGQGGPGGDQQGRAGERDQRGQGEPGQNGRPPQTDQVTRSVPEPDAPASKLKLTSPVVGQDGMLPAKFTCDGMGISPPVAWTNAPDGTKGYAVVMHHNPPDGSTHVYWVLAGLDGNITKVAENAMGIGQVGANTVNRNLGYAPPCSKGPGRKSYFITVYALKEVWKPKEGERLTRDSLLTGIKGLVLGKSVLEVGYARPDGVGEKKPQ
ncbi:MAG: hypothetical protein RLZZ78_692 [Armatimonadota bacterium]